MTLEIIDVIQVYQAAQYDGSNGAAICAEFSSTFDFDNGTTLRFLDGDSIQRDVLAGKWVVWQGGSFAAIFDTMPQGAFRSINLNAPTQTTSTGSASVPNSVAGNAGNNYDVDISPAMADTNYAYYAELVGPPNIVSGHSILSHAILDANTVRVVVQSGALSLAGATVQVTAWAVTV